MDCRFDLGPLRKKTESLSLALALKPLLDTPLKVNAIPVINWYTLVNFRSAFWPSLRMIMTDKWLTIEQIADYLQVSREKIYRLCQKGTIPASKIGGQWRFDIKEVEMWAREQRPKRKTKL